jgi:ABC-type glycerol-3-phosphate transport system substrate-binding protein
MMNKFQIGSIIFFMAIAILALLMFSGIIPTPGRDPAQTGSTKMVVWGTLPSGKMSVALSKSAELLQTGQTIAYVEKSPENLEIELLRASDAGASPDIVIFPTDLLLQIDDTLYTFPEESVNERTIKDTFIEGADAFITPQGVTALPFLVDPLVMYWNRDLFNKERITEPPKTWDEVRSLTQILTKTDGRGKILQSAAAIGGSRNVDHFKDIISLFFFQAGDSIISRTVAREPGIFLGGLGENDSLKESSQTPTASALAFYTGFANVRASNYSWNSSFNSSRESFIEGTVALYFAPASDYAVITNKNPHLNFDVAPVPQLQSSKDVNFGRIYALGLPKNGKNLNNAFVLATTLTTLNDKTTDLFIEELFLPPARRSLLSRGASNAILDVFYKEAIISKGWLDPNPQETEKIFSGMIDDTVSEARGPGEAIIFASDQLEELLNGPVKNRR